MHTALVCDQDTRIRERLKAALHALGIDEVFECNQYDDALDSAFNHLPDLLLLEAAPPVNGIDLIVMIKKQQPVVSILLLADQGYEELFKQAGSNHVDSFLAKTVEPHDFLRAVKLAIHTAQRVADLRSELEKTRSDLEQRKIIERAKGILMVREVLTEEQAYKKMRSHSMSQRVSMATLAEQILKRHG